MFRDRLKKRVRRLAVKAFGMEFDVEDRDPNAGGRADPADFDPSVIPKIVDGAGDTPGPNHKQDIGRTWVAAQLAGGVAPFFIDIRTPLEMAGGVLPGAHLFPAESIKDHLDGLPQKDQRVTIYDQTGEQGSMEIAAWLRDQGWGLARRLQGGYAEWIEHGETVDSPLSSSTDYAIGDPIEIDGHTGHVLACKSDTELWIWTSKGELVVKK